LNVWNSRDIAFISQIIMGIGTDSQATQSRQVVKELIALSVTSDRAFYLVLDQAAGWGKKKNPSPQGLTGDRPAQALKFKRNWLN
jgi:hypothetical protein